MVVERTRFGQRLRQQLDSRGVSARELARRLNPGDPESARRSIARWLAPRGQAVQPSAASIAAVADALGCQVEELASDDDEEESDPVTDLVLAIRRIVREEVRA